MKTNSKSIFIVLTLLTLLIGMVPASPVHAESLPRPLQASGDFVFAKSMSGTAIGSGEAIAIDTYGFIYTAGYFSGTVDFDPGAGVFNLVNAGSNDIYISKLSSNGSFVWAKQVEDANLTSIALDVSGNVYLTGSFSNTVDFDPGAGAANLTSAGASDIFISKLDSSGNFVWAKRMGGTSYDTGSNIALNTSGEIYTTGSFNNIVDFDPGAGVANLTSNGNTDVFITKLDSNGNFIWAKNMGGASSDQGLAIAVDTNGNIYSSGTFETTADFDPNAGATNLTSAGDYDIFVSKLDSNGSFIWAKSMGGIDSDVVADVAVDSSGNVYTTGSFNATADFNPSLGGVDNLVSAGFADVFVSKLDSNGDYVWAKRMGGTYYDVARGIALDTSDNIYTTGYFSQTADFDPGLGFTNLSSGGGFNDIFVSKLDSNGNFGFAKSMGGAAAHDYGNAITLDPSGNIYTTGYFAGTADFDPSGVVNNLTSTGGYDIFISQLEHGDVAPTVYGTFQATPSPTSAASVDFYLLFSEDVTGVDPSDFNLTTTGSISGASVTGGNGSNSSYTITVNTGTGNGTIRLNVVDDDTITDATLKPLGGVGAGNGNYNSGEVYTIIKSPTFADVPLDYWANAYIERLYNAGITGGCTAIPLNYCPDSTVTRAQMAVFLLKSIHGASYTPPAVGVSTGFTDVATDYWAAAWIKQLAAESITSGCGNGIYCPDATVTRAQMSIFLLKSKHGSIYNPTNAIGVFSDVPMGYWADKWIEQLAVEGVTSGCGVGVYCPDADVTRAQMAVFLVRMFNLP